MFFLFFFVFLESKNKQANLPNYMMNVTGHFGFTKAYCILQDQTPSPFGGEMKHSGLCFFS